MQTERVDKTPSGAAQFALFFFNLRKFLFEEFLVSHTSAETEEETKRNSRARERTLRVPRWMVFIILDVITFSHTHIYI